MSRTFTASLANRTYEIAQLPIRPASAWRTKFRGPVQQILDVLQSVGNLQIDKVQDLIPVVRQAAEVLMGSMDTVGEMVFAYSPLLEADREYILANAYDDELVAVFVMVLKQAFPLDQMVRLLQAAGSSGGKGSAT